MTSAREIMTTGIEYLKTTDTAADAAEKLAQADIGDRGQTLSAGEIGAADGTAGVHSAVEVVIGEIPAADDPTTMLWTARCSEADHDLLGHFRTREEAETARAEHLASAHGGITA